MDEYFTIVQNLPPDYVDELARLDTEIARTVQEIRLRTGRPVLFTVGGRLVPCTKYLPKVTVCRFVDAAALEQCFLYLCHHSLYAYEEELKSGYLTLAGGCRVGAAGVWGPCGLERISSINLRVARWNVCALPYAVTKLVGDGGGILVAGPPGSGKTTFLRSLIRQLAYTDKIFCAVDEREELVAPGIAGGAAVCDTYTRLGRAAGIQMALRTMNPEIILCDELGSVQDALALEAGVASGVVFYASVHSDGNAVQQRPHLRRLLHTGAFQTVVYLEGRAHPGRVQRLVSL